MLSKKAASEISYDLGSGTTQSSIQPLPRTARGSLEIFGGGRAHPQTAALYNYSSKSQRGQDNSAVRSVGGVGGDEHIRDGRLFPEGSSLANEEPERAVLKQKDQVSRWLADTSVDGVSKSSSRSRSQSPLPPRVLGSEKRGSENLSLVDDLDLDLLARLRISESQDWEEHVKLSELLGGIFKPAGEELEARYGSSSSSHSSLHNKPRPSAAASVCETPSEWEGVFEGKGVKKGGLGVAGYGVGNGNGRPPSGNSRQTRQTGASEWEEALPQGGGTAQANEVGRDSSNMVSRGSTEIIEICEVSAEWEGILPAKHQGGGGAGNDGCAPSSSNRQSRSSDASPDDLEWEKVPQTKGASTGTGGYGVDNTPRRTSETSGMSPEWEGILQPHPRGSGNYGVNKPPINNSRHSRTSSTSAISPDEWERMLQVKEAKSKAGAGAGAGAGKDSSTRSRRTSSTSDTSEVPPEVPPEWEAILQGQQQREGVANSIGDRPPFTSSRRQSRTSIASETSPDEWERVLLQGAAASAAPRERTSRQSLQSNGSGTSCMSIVSVVSERGAQWGYEVKLHESTNNPEDRLSGSSWISHTSASNGSKSSWTTSEASSGASINYSRSVPGVSKNIKDALASFQLAFVVCDATDPNYPVLYASAGFFSMTGYSANEVVGKNCRFLQGEYTEAADVSKIREALSEGKIYTGKILNYKKDTSPFWNLLTISPIKDDGGKLIKWIGMLAEVSENAGTEEENLRSEMQSRIEKESQRHAKDAVPKAGVGYACTPPSRGVEVSTQTSFSVEEPLSSKSSETQRRMSYSLTNQSSRYSLATSSRSVDPSVDLPEWQQSAGKMRAEVAALKREVEASNAKASNNNRLVLDSSAKGSKSFKLGKFFKKIKGGISNLSSSSSSSKSSSKSSSAAKPSDGTVEAPFEFSDDSGEEGQEPDTNDPRVAAEHARTSKERKQQRRSGNNFAKNPSTADTTSKFSKMERVPPPRRHNAHNYSTPSNVGGSPASAGLGTGNMNMDQFCVVHT